MAGVWKRPTDKARGKSGKWSIWYVDGDGRRRTKAGFTDKAKSLELAHRLESDARLVR